MVAAVLYSIVQLAVLSWPSRSVRFSTLMLMVSVGMYPVAVVAALAQFGYVRLAMASTIDSSWTAAMATTSWTFTPVVEELAKVTPLVLLAVRVRTRFQWGFTDYVVLGAAIGAGFRLLELLAIAGTSAAKANPLSEGGWTIPTGNLTGTSYVPGLGQILGSLFPQPLGTYVLVDFAPHMVVNPHLAWTAMCGLGVAVLLRVRGSRRLLGLVEPVKMSV
jgi:RsiW-degrading membrane proteinase PrsW (M82 family)